MPKNNRKVKMNSQISLNNEYLGQEVHITKSKDGSLKVTPGDYIPTSNLFLYKDDNMAKLERALIRIESTPRSENFKEIERLINGS